MAKRAAHPLGHRGDDVSGEGLARQQLDHARHDRRDVAELEASAAEGVVNLDSCL